MPLTADQKRNMLILAGYEPRRFADMGPRIRNGTWCLSCTLNGMIQGRGNMWGIRKWMVSDPTYDPTDWAWIDLSNCPDELIYQAIGSE